MDKIDEILEQIKSVGSDKVTQETFNELKEAMDNRDKELDQKMGSMEDNMEKAIAKMSTAIADGFTKANYSEKEATPRFKDFGEFASKVKGREMDIKDLSEGTGNLGGYLVPTEYSQQIQQINLENSIVRPRATVLTLKYPTYELPSIDPSSNANGSQFGGATAYWEDELAFITESNPTFDNIKLEVNKLAAYVEDSNEIEDDAVTNIGQLLMNLYGKVLAFKEDSAFISGDGVKKPLGILTAPCLVTVSRATASQVHPVDIVTMISRFRGSLDKAIITVNQSVLPQIYQLKDDNGNFIWSPGNSGSIAEKAMGTLYGIPMIVTEKNSALGTEGDLIMADWSHYLIGDRGGLVTDYSDHFKFQNDARAYRIKKRVDGQPWLKSAITPYKGGSTLSPFVALS